MPTVAVRPRARIDLTDIWTFIAEDSEAQADAFADRFDGQFQLLARRPSLGRMRNDMLPGLRTFPFERYVIYYRATQSGIEIIRVLHSARDAEAQFRPRT